MSTQSLHSRESQSQHAPVSGAKRLAPSRFEVTIDAADAESNHTRNGMNHSDGSNIPSHEQIAKRAYELYQQRDCAAGRCEKNWLDAEHALQVESQTDSSAPTRHDDLAFQGKKMGHAVFMATPKMPALVMGGGVNHDQDSSHLSNGSTTRKA